MATICSFCQCGCGQPIPERNKNGPIRFKHGHNHKGKCNYWSMKNNVKPRASHRRAVKILIDAGIIECQSKNQYCLGRLEGHHIDKNPLNNDLSNLLLLCKSHHWVADHGNVQLTDLRLMIVKPMKRTCRRRYWNW